LSVATADSRGTAPQDSRQPRLSPLAIVAIAAGLALVAWSIYVRTRAFDTAYWIDEGLSIGIAQHGFFDIPGVLRQDGSPPLYYMLLHFWLPLFGTSESATHALSLVFSTLTIPVGLWAGWSLFGRRAGIVTAIICAGSPFLTGYAQETRMYSLVVLLSLICTAAFLLVFVQRRRGYIPLFAVSLVSLLYTHIWSAFYVLGAGASILWLLWLRRDERRELFRDALFGFGLAFLLYLPWLPTALYQVRHTGAPWAQGPNWRASQQLPRTLAGGQWREVAMITLVALAGIVVALRERKRAAESRAPAEAAERDRAAWVAMGLLVTMVVLAWTISKLSQVWVPRYFAIFFGPFLISIGWAFARAGVVGIAGLVILGAGFWFYPHTPERKIGKSNVTLVAADGAARLHRGDIVLSTHPEQIPLIYLYMHRDGAPPLQYATELGRQSDPQVMDWRDAVERLKATRVKYDLEPVLDRMRVGQQLYLVRPVVTRKNEWTAPWTSLVKRRSAQWIHAMDRDGRFKLTKVSNAYLHVGHRNGAVQGRLYVKTRR
jgi:mannosyltransferase